jgi:hypothetical protein
MRNRIIFSLLLFVMVTALFNVSAFAQGCAMCKTALEQSPEGRAMAKSFDYGILFLMGFPYVMIGAAGIAIYRAYRVKNRDSQQQVSPELRSTR